MEWDDLALLEYDRSDLGVLWDSLENGNAYLDIKYIQHHRWQCLEKTHSSTLNGKYSLFLAMTIAWVSSLETSALYRLIPVDQSLFPLLVSCTTPVKRTLLISPPPPALTSLRRQVLPHKPLHTLFNQHPIRSPPVKRLRNKHIHGRHIDQHEPSRLPPQPKDVDALRQTSHRLCPSRRHA